MKATTKSATCKFEDLPEDIQAFYLDTIEPTLFAWFSSLADPWTLEYNDKPKVREDGTVEEPPASFGKYSKTFSTRKPNDEGSRAEFLTITTSSGDMYIF